MMGIWLRVPARADVRGLQVGQKLLTISIAGYNVEKTIARTIDSCLCKHMDLLDIIVVDDGATDGTDAIVEEYANKYPGIISLAKKENGGYGTTIMTSVGLARGKYFKVLDGDDCYATDALDECLEVLSENDVDLYVSPYYRTSPTDQKVMDQVDPDCCGAMPIEALHVPWRLSMHAVLFRTSLLREAGIKLPSHCCYTDVLYASTGLRGVQSVYVSHRPLYDYKVDQDEEQSTSATSLIKHRKDRLVVINELLRLYDAPADGESKVSHHVTIAWVAAECTWLLELLFRIDPGEENLKDIQLLQTALKERPEIRREIDGRSKSGKVLSRVPSACYRPVRAVYSSVMRNRPYHG
jgi:hypothetical protein